MVVEDCRDIALGIEKLAVVSILGTGRVLEEMNMQSA